MLHTLGQIPCSLHIRNILLVLERLLRLRVDNRNGSRLRQAFVGAADAGLVNALFDDFVAHVIGPINIKPFLIEAEADSKWRVLHQNQMCYLERHRETAFEPLGLPGHATHHEELPEPEVV